MADPDGDLGGNLCMSGRIRVPVLRCVRCMMPAARHQHSCNCRSGARIWWRRVHAYTASACADGYRVIAYCCPFS